MTEIKQTAWRITGIMVAFSIIYFIYVAGYWDGAEDVASGSYICELADQPDKTPEWLCHNAQ